MKLTDFTSIAILAAVTIISVIAALKIKEAMDKPKTA